MRFCAEIVGEPRVGQKLELALVTKNVAGRPVATISLAKVPLPMRSRLVTLWVDGRRLGQGGADLSPEYVVHLDEEDSIRAVVQTEYSVQAGHNEVLVSVPYWWPSTPAFTDEEIRTFDEAGWRAPKVLPVIGPLAFDAH
jgi:hypothetical protein